LQMCISSDYKCCGSLSMNHATIVLGVLYFLLGISMATQNSFGGMVVAFIIAGLIVVAVI